jgi:hypothetical protein
VKTQYYEGDVEFDGDVNGVPVPDYEVELESFMVGIEAGIVVDSEFEFFFDFMGNEVENPDSNAEVDGAEVGIGIRSPYPRQEGFSVDWSFRLSAHYLENDTTVSGQDAEDELAGGGIDTRIGACYAYPLESGYFFSTHAGLLSKYWTGEEEGELNGVRVLDVDYELDSLGAYLGFRLSGSRRPHTDVRINFFFGTDDLYGAMLSAGVRF